MPFQHVFPPNISLFFRSVCWHFPRLPQQLYQTPCLPPLSDFFSLLQRRPCGFFLTIASRWWQPSNRKRESPGRSNEKQSCEKRAGKNWLCEGKGRGKGKIKQSLHLSRASATTADCNNNMAKAAGFSFFPFISIFIPGCYVASI